MNALINEIDALGDNDDGYNTPPGQEKLETVISPPKPKKKRKGKYGDRSVVYS